MEVDCPRPDWFDGIRLYIEKGELPEDKLEARRIRYKSLRYALDQNGTLYKKSVDGPPLKYLPKDRVMAVLEEVHGGLIGNHVGEHTLAYKILRLGYFWPTLKEDAREFTSKCVACQLCSNQSHMPAVPLTNVEIC